MSNVDEMMKVGGGEHNLLFNGKVNKERGLSQKSEFSKRPPPSTFRIYECRAVVS